MADLKLVIGTRNTSSWSLRGWLAVKATGQPFEEEVIELDRPDTRQRILRHSTAARVPILHDGDLTVHDSLAIAEYLAERFPAAGLWPEDAAARAVARAVSAEMHAGFAELREQMPMDCRARLPGQAMTPAVAEDIARITEIWRDTRARFGKGGDFLFGRFGIADIMFAPVVSRFVTYGVELDEVSARYRDAIMSWPAMVEWFSALDAA